MPFRRSLFLAGAVLYCFATSAAVRYIPEKQLWVLETAHTSYVLGRDASGQIQHVYWGARIPRDEDFSQAWPSPSYAFEAASSSGEFEEYPGWGGMRYAEPCLKVTFDGGVRDLVLKYASYETGEDTLTLRLKDIQQDLFVDLKYQVFAANDIIRKQVRIINRTGKPVQVESAQSGVWYLPPGDGYRLTYLTGRWAGETQLSASPSRRAKKVMESRRGNTSHQVESVVRHRLRR